MSTADPPKKRHTPDFQNKRPRTGPLSSTEEMLAVQLAEWQTLGIPFEDQVRLISDMLALTIKLEVDREKIPPLRRYDYTQVRMQRALTVIVDSIEKQLRAIPRE